MPRIKLDPFENVGDGRTASMITEVIWPNTLEQIVLHFTPGVGGAFVKDDIEELKVKFGTKTVWDVTGEQLVKMNAFEVLNEGVTVLTLPFYNQRARNLAQAYLSCPDFAALAVRKVQVSLKITGATDPFTIDAWADVVAPGLLAPAGRIVFRQLLRQQLTPSAAEVDKPQSINIGQAKGARLRRLHFFSPLVTDLSIKRDGLDFFEKLPLSVQNDLLKNKGWVPQTDVYSFVADEDDNADKTLTTIRDDAGGGSLVPMQILMSTSGAGAFDVVADVLAGLDG
ncbi:hypothetical protein JM946_12650 [Steroidobacter sp. S1-65]|uniref:Viral coat protein P2 N-terminal domain-containing protein n=1 Tax=Steroidobacter gossypii TaxID=2805490 RepID=A0ABS1WXC1_9GAMM|nr:major capsid protein P2 [Steroidobacter gossypii]MBM0105608.1 hypothetical protein [Steroidobacter gossypii]